MFYSMKYFYLCGLKNWGQLMAYLNNVMIIRHELMARLVKMFQAGELESKINALPVELYPKDRNPRGRCCIYKERAITRYKMLPLLGFEVPEDDIDLYPIEKYAHEAIARERVSGSILTVVDEACTSCVQANYVVTNLCRGCVASPCVMNCPKNAIRFTPSGQTEIKPELCINCGLCQKACPYHAIVYMPIPCEEACPVGAIKKNERGVEEIDPDKCIYCGKCITACPFGAIFELSAIIDVLKSIEQKQQVIAMVAPSVFAQYAEEPGKVFAAIQQIGFSEVVEVARGAEKTARHEAEELKEKLEEGQAFMTTSCCPSYVEAVRKHVTGFVITSYSIHYTKLYEVPNLCPVVKNTAFRFFDNCFQICIFKIGAGDEVVQVVDIRLMVFAIVKLDGFFRITSYNVCYTKLLRFVLWSSKRISSLETR